jgi:hypothetical protein
MDGSAGVVLRPVPRVLVHIEDVAAMLGRSSQTVRRHELLGLMPKAVRRGKTAKLQWNVAEIEAWAAAGCPPMSEWVWPPPAKGGGRRGK